MLSSSAVWLVLANVTLAAIVLIPLVAIGLSAARAFFGRAKDCDSKRVTLVHIPWIGTVPVLDEER